MIKELDLISVEAIIVRLTSTICFLFDVYVSTDE